MSALVPSPRLLCMLSWSPRLSGKSTKSLQSPSLNSVSLLHPDFPGGASGKEPIYQCRRQRHGLDSLGHEDPLEKGMAIHSSILAWRSPWTEKPGRLQSIGSVGHNWSDLACRSWSPAPRCKPPSSHKDMRNVWGYPGGSGGKESACNTGDPGLIPRLWRSHGEESGNAL